MRNPPKLAPAMAPGKDDLDSALADLEVSLGANDPDLEKLVSCDFVIHCEE